MALTCAIFGSLCNILINKCDQVRSTLLVFYAGISGTIISILGCLVNSQETFSHLGELVVIDWLILTVISMVGILGKFINKYSLYLAQNVLHGVEKFFLTPFCTVGQKI